MNKLTGIGLAAATLAVALSFGDGVALAKGTTSSGTSGNWPTAYPLPVQPGTVIAQTSTTARVRSTDTVAVVLNKLDNLYLTQRGCTRKLAVNKPRDYFCANPSSGKSDEVYFTFAALDPTAADPSRSQSNAFLATG